MTNFIIHEPAESYHFRSRSGEYMSIFCLLLQLVIRDLKMKIKKILSFDVAG